MFIKTLADTIEWMAEEIQKGKEPCQNKNSAIHSISMLLTLELCKRMTDDKHGLDFIQSKRK